MTDRELAVQSLEQAARLGSQDAAHALTLLASGRDDDAMGVLDAGLDANIDAEVARVLDSCFGM